MKYIKSLVLGLLVAASLTSCNDWLDINDDPNTPSEASAKIENLLPWVEHYTLYGSSCHGYRVQFICQALTTTSRTSRDGCSAQWEATNSMCTTPYQFFFVGAGPNIISLYDKAMAEGAWHYAGAALLLKSYGFMMMTDMYGEMPYTEALGASATPKYDDGKTIFEGCLKDINSAIVLLSKTQDPGVTALSAGDSWNGGDVNKWLKMAYLLKARYLNNLSKKSSLYDPDAILAALSMAQQSTNDNTMIAHKDILENSSDILFGDPLQASPMFSNGGMGGGYSARFTKWFVDLLVNFDGKGIEDPRADKIIPWIQVNGSNGKTTWIRSAGVDMTSDIRIKKGPFALTRNSTDNTITTKNKQTVKPHSWYCDSSDPSRWGDTIYVGARSGAVGYYTTPNVLYTKDYADGYAESSSNVYLRPNSPSHFATYSEACFIKAEVLFKKGSTGEAFNAYKEGIKSNIEAIDKSLEVWAGDAALKDCPSFTRMDQSKIQAYLDGAIGNAGNLTMEKIMTQKFIAMLYQPQNWNDMRRHDYKDYMNWQMPYEYSLNAGSLKTIPLGSQWRRIKQCSHEINYNSKNLSAIQPHYLDDNIWTYPVWWDTAE